MSGSTRSEKRNLIDAVKTPLAFFSLIIVLLIGPTLLKGISAIFGAENTFLSSIIVLTPLLLILIVTAVAFWRPEALRGKRYIGLDKLFACALAGEICNTLDRFLSKDQKAPAYESLCNTITSSPYARGPMKKFCEAFVGEIMRRAPQLHVKAKKFKGRRSRAKTK